MKILASAHDAGGANLLIHKFRNVGDVDFILTGPAAQIANSLGIRYHDNSNGVRIEQYEKLYVASNSKREKSDELLDLALASGIRTVGVLDHWVNYSTRWANLPDKIEVQDFSALLGGFFEFGFKVRIQRNMYIKYIKERAQEDIEKSKSLLVILQPISGSFDHRKKEGCFCTYIVKALERFPEISAVTLREHASTPSDVCREFIELNTHASVKTTGLLDSLSSDLSGNSLILGLDSYALFVARKLGKDVMVISKQRRSWFAPRYAFLE